MELPPIWKHDNGQRYPELDLWRGIALIMMVIYHFIFDLVHFEVMDIQLTSGPIHWFTIIRAANFLGIAGVSLSLSWGRRSDRAGDGEKVYIHYLRRGAWLFSLGMLITLSTWLYMPEGMVYFGVLHCIGLSIILAYPFLGKEKAALTAGISFIILGMILKGIRVSHHWLLPLGIRPESFYTVDYFPLFPWLGVILLGTVIGGRLFPEGRRAYKAPRLPDNAAISGIAAIGRNTLILYLLHQPVIICMLALFGVINL